MFNLDALERPKKALPYALAWMTFALGDVVPGQARVAARKDFRVRYKNSDAVRQVLDELAGDAVRTRDFIRALAEAYIAQQFAELIDDAAEKRWAARRKAIRRTGAHWTLKAAQTFESPRQRPTKPEGVIRDALGRDRVPATWTLTKRASVAVELMDRFLGMKANIVTVARTMRRMAEPKKKAGRKSSTTRRACSI